LELCREGNTGDLNQALRIYLGSNASGGVKPYGGADRIRASYGSNSPEVLKEIQHFIDGLFEREELLNLPSLVAIGAFVEGRARSARPDLEGDVCRAIGNYVSYSYK
jgi:hypothetical protein